MLTHFTVKFVLFFDETNINLARRIKSCIGRVVYNEIFISSTSSVSAVRSTVLYACKVSIVKTFLVLTEIKISALILSVSRIINMASNDLIWIVQQSELINALDILPNTILLVQKHCSLRILKNTFTQLVDLYFYMLCEKYRVNKCTRDKMICNSYFLLTYYHNLMEKSSKAFLIYSKI